MASIQKETITRCKLLRTYNFFKQQGISHTEIMALLVLTREHSGDELRWLTQTQIPEKACR